MVEVKTAAWALQHQAFLESLGRAAIGEGPWPYNIVSSFAISYGLIAGL